jgi:glycosyltransferase involved in cell wall biosynthesis
MDNKNPEISVIMPTYNHANYIKKSIHSVLTQTYQDFELIIIDNYSSDSTNEIIAEIKDERITLEFF